MELLFPDTDFQARCREYNRFKVKFIVPYPIFLRYLCRAMGNALKTGLLLLFLLTGTLVGFSQRNYKPHSVLSTGSWYKIAVRETGVYRLDMGFLKSLGLPSSLPSDQLQVYGRREARFKSKVILCFS